MSPSGMDRTKGMYVYDYAKRQAANEASLAAAEHHAEIWEQHEIELLEERWGETTLPEIAELLGRTIEACRQKHYELAQQVSRQARMKRAKSTQNSQWDRGWLAVQAMGY